MHYKTLIFVLIFINFSELSVVDFDRLSSETLETLSEKFDDLLEAKNLEGDVTLAVSFMPTALPIWVHTCAPSLLAELELKRTMFGKLTS